MAIRFTYPVKSTLSSADLILITDSEDANKTKQVTASALPGFSGVGIETLGVSGSAQSGAAQTLEVEAGNNFLTISSATNTHTFGMTGALPLANGGTGLTATSLTPGTVLQVNAAGTGLEYMKVSLPVRSKNSSGATIKKGAPVFVDGLDVSGEPIISKFYADSPNAENITPLGLLIEDAADGSDVEVISSGLIENFDFSQVNGTVATGKKVYLTPQSGEGSGLALTVDKPTSGVDISIGTVIDPSNNGSLLVSPSGGEAIELPNANAVGSILYSDSNNQFIELGIGAANRVLTVNSSGNAPEWSTIDTGVTTINFGTTGLTPNTNASGAITVAGVLGTANGGTNRTSYTAGDLLYASSSSVLSSVAIGSAGQFLQVNNLGTAPEWGGGPASYSTITGTTSNITTSSANSTAVFAVNADTSMTITGNGVSNLTWALGTPSSTKKGGVKAEQGPAAEPTQSLTGTWFPVDFVQADNSKLAVKVPVTNGGSAESVTETVTNNSGVSIPKGSPLHISGNDGTNPTVKIADATKTSVAMPVSGLANETIANGATGEMIITGIISGINTSSLDGATPKEGDVVYVNNSAGSGSLPWLTTTYPTGEANLIQNVGIIVRDDLTQGSIQVTCTGRTTATPNLDRGSIFLGNSFNQSEPLSIGRVDTVLTSDGTDVLWTKPNGLLLNSNSFRGTNASQTNPPQHALTDLTTTTTPFGEVKFNPTATGTGGTTTKVYANCSRPVTATDIVRVEASFYMKHEDEDGTPDRVRVFAGLHHTSGDIAPASMTYGWQMSGYTDSDDIIMDVVRHKFCWDIQVADLLDTSGSAASAGDACYFFLKMGSIDLTTTNTPTVIFGQYWKASLDTITANSIHAGGPCTMDVYQIKNSRYNTNPISPV
jgi:hypothetical protein